ncbi:MAG: acyl-CoA/acyl-ACP dehydrogenase [Hyphomicrobiales bacterium]|nr:acyl-CoA/acyl-ACP dehydrogenase [Hyphomicrobiales bacterium]
MGAAVLDHPVDVATLAATALCPLTRRIDEDGYYPEDVLRALGEAGAYGQHVADGPLGLAGAAEDMMRVGEVCGSTAFCVWCQDALGWYLAASDNTVLRARLLRQVASGAQLGGTGLSNPMKAFAGLGDIALKGERVRGGWRVRGRLPWVSNLGPDHLFAGIFTTGARAAMAVFSCAQDGLKLTDCAPFIALEGTRTFGVQMRDVFVPDDMVLAEDAAVFVPKIRQGFVLLQMGMALGAAHAAAHWMRRDGATQTALAVLPLGPDEIDARAALLQARLAERAREALDPARPAFLETLRLRLDGSQLALAAAQASLIAHGARGYLKGSNAERVQREAHFAAIVSPSVKHILTELHQG